MELAKRLEIYKRIEAHRGRPMIAYITSTRPGLQVAMASDAVREFIDQIDAIPVHAREVDILLHSAGGDALTAWKLMSLLRERFDAVDVLVPSTAFSAATLFALGANTIVMHPHASLGPIDPQINARTGDGKQRLFAYEDVGSFLKFLAEDAGIRDQPHMTALAEKLLNTVDPLVIGASRRASELSGEVGARLLSMHMTDASAARRIAKDLNKSFFAHGDAVSRRRARELGLPIADADAALEALLWEAFLGFEGFLQLRDPWQPHMVLMTHPSSAAALQPPGSFQLPMGLPPQVADHMFNALLNTLLQRAQAGHAVPYRLVNAVLESPRAASEHVTEGTMSGLRVPDGIQVIATDSESRWKLVPVPSVASTVAPTQDGEQA